MMMKNLRRSRGKRAALRPLLSLGVAIGAWLVSACGTSDQDQAKDRVYPENTCLWGGPYVDYDDETNFALLDTGAVYWTTRVVIPEGSSLSLDGEYAYARYLSLTAYNADAEATDALHDVQITPDPGASNPYVPGNARQVGARSYTVAVTPDDGSGGEQGTTNALYVASASGGEITLIYRIYVSDEGRGITGGVALPDPVLTQADGQQLRGQAACDALGADNAILPSTVIPDWQYQLLREQAFRAEGFPAENPAVWYRFFNTTAYGTCAYFKLCGGQPDDSGGVYNNLDNAYIYTFLNRGFGSLAVLRGRLPLTPATLSGPKTSAEGELRYWSLCSYEAYSQRVAGCVFDEQLPLDDNRDYVIVVARPEDRPSNATKACGVAFVAWSPEGDGFGNEDDGELLLRNMLPSPGFTQAVQNVTTPGEEPSVMGDYLPRIDYMDVPAFEQLGCPVRP